jgi:hypothetical protein
MNSHSLSHRQKIPDAPAVKLPRKGLFKLRVFCARLSDEENMRSLNPLIGQSQGLIVFAFGYFAWKNAMLWKYSEECLAKTGVTPFRRTFAVIMRLFLRHERLW